MDGHIYFEYSKAVLSPRWWMNYLVDFAGREPLHLAIEVVAIVLILYLMLSRPYNPKAVRKLTKKVRPHPAFVFPAPGISFLRGPRYFVISLPHPHNPLSPAPRRAAPRHPSPHVTISSHIASLGDRPICPPPLPPPHTGGSRSDRRLGARAARARRHS